MSFLKKHVVCAISYSDLFSSYFGGQRNLASRQDRAFPHAPRGQRFRQQDYLAQESFLENRDMHEGRLSTILALAGPPWINVEAFVRARARLAKR